MTILEGESLVNDATALVLYRTAVGAVVTGSFLWHDVLVQFLLAGLGGVAIGLAVGGLTRLVLTMTRDSASEIAVTLLASYVAWVTAERLHVSAVLACVAGGIHLRRHFSALVSPITRFHARAVWETTVFILNGVIFILIGLEVGDLQSEFMRGDLWTLLGQAALISAGVILVRLIWVPVAAYLPRLIPSVRARDPMPPASHLILVGWTGMRGIVSLAAALGLPLTLSSGQPFPYRAHILVITFVVILVTLVLQGLTLAPLIRRLHLQRDESLNEEEALVREQMATAALARLDELSVGDETVTEHVDRLRLHYGRRRGRFSQPSQTDPDCSDAGARAFRRLRHETLSSERRMAIALRNRGVIGDEVLHRVEQELDVEAIRLGLGVEAKSQVDRS